MYDNAGTNMIGFLYGWFYRLTDTAIPVASPFRPFSEKYNINGYILKTTREKLLNLDDYYNLVYLNDSYQLSDLIDECLLSNSYLGLSLHWITFYECTDLTALWVHFWNICGNFPYGKPIMNDIVRLKETKCRHKICARFFPIIYCIID